MNINQANQKQTPPSITSASPTLKKKTPWLLISLVVLLLSATGVLGYKYYQVKQQLDNQRPDRVEFSREIRKEIASKKWQSPSGQKHITYKYTPEFDEYQLHFINKDKELNIGQMNEPVADLEVTWSPDESYVVVSNTGYLTRMFCVTNALDCRGEEVFYVLGGVVPVFWSDNQNVYIRYNDMGNDIISRFTFSSDNIYPQELVLYKKPSNPFFGYKPVSISPNSRYLVMEQLYEGPPQLAIMNIQTGKIIGVRDNDKLYILGSKPNYTWNGNILTFKGGLTSNGSWLELADETHSIDDTLLQSYTIDASTIF